ncbi:carboxylesterase/lipase family protein [Rhizorhabdus dicambivorans]|uniref:Carboxylic ester hydrolase n=1 Tax=Rhizorhabdus dicambivorans TaxID=1850238 RepID=A0A2A4FVB1_9SPHN|nr:carboxylesterase family protein [Rhizorhabdus dicambivorans]ATE64540.1 carboxylesterase [Rhizorhabdus dicambivorans]PCE41634.1 carboxylesterase [Rhizorhabdus dicambivorans]
MADAIATTSSGRVRGIGDGRVRRFLGIPYAASPTGERRFALPVSHPAWDGIRDATAPGATAPHRVKDFPGLDVSPLIGTGWVRGDDYLAANVFTPDDAGTGRPVMVWIHGGGFVIGSKDAAIQDCATFARDGIVCFAINYRLGVDGFLPIPGIPTNLGLRDMIAALHWVQANAAAFGGDPNNVTVFGESAGAMAIADLIASPLAKGLFRRAIIQSGHAAMTRSIPVMQRLVRKLAKLLRITPDKAGFMSVDQEATLDAVDKVSQPTARIDLRDADGHEPVFGISRFVPVHGDDVLPLQPLEALKRGAGAEIDVLIGTNAEEMNLYLVPTGVRDKVGGLFATFILSRSQPRARKALKAYGLGQAGKKAGQALLDATNDLVFRWPARRFAEEHQGRTHMYEFDWRSPAFGGELGACHGMELPFTFDSLACATGPQGLAGEAPPQALADRVHRIWVDFARDGSLPWDAFDRESRKVFSLLDGKALREEPMAAQGFLP